MRCESRFSAYSSTFEIGSVLEVKEKMRIGASAGFILRNEGGVGMSGGS